MIGAAGWPARKEPAKTSSTSRVRPEFTDVVLAQGCQLSMDGRGAWRDNVFVERLWRSVKYERVYLKAYDGVSAARADIADYMGWYNAARAHSRLGDLTPDEHYFAHLPALAMAA
jgi:putative transposase